jgi:hypothetical protein
MGTNGFLDENIIQVNLFNRPLRKSVLYVPAFIALCMNLWTDFKMQKKVAILLHLTLSPLPNIEAPLPMEINRFSHPKGR